MQIVGEYSFKGGAKVVRSRYPHLLEEIERAIARVNAAEHLTKKSKEKTMPGKMLY